MLGEMACARHRATGRPVISSSRGHRSQGLQLIASTAARPLPSSSMKAFADAKREFLCSCDRCLHAPPPLFVKPKQGGRPNTVHD